MVIISVMVGMVTAVDGNAIVPVPLPVPLSATACAKFVPEAVLGGLLNAALSVNVMVPLGEVPA